VFVKTSVSTISSCALVTYGRVPHLVSYNCVGVFAHVRIALHLGVTTKFIRMHKGAFVPILCTTDDRTGVGPADISDLPKIATRRHTVYALILETTTPVFWFPKSEQWCLVFVCCTKQRDYIYAKDGKHNRHAQRNSITTTKTYKRSSHVMSPLLEYVPPRRSGALCPSLRYGCA